LEIALRQSVINVCLAFAMASTFPQPSIADESKVTIVLIGDSYLSSYGLTRDDRFDAKLNEALTARGLLVDVLDTGYTSTSVSGVRLLDGLLENPDYLGTAQMHAVIIELGQNDCGRWTLEETRAALDTMLAQLARSHIPALLVGTSPYDICETLPSRTNYNALYVQMFDDLAAKYGDLYYRDFKDGVAGNLALMQGDRDHPNAKGDAVIVALMLPVVQDLVARAKMP
jgi:acyl-CoA thioesterase I